MSLCRRPTSTCHGKQSDASNRLTTRVSEEPATSGDPSPTAGGGNHFRCAGTESQRLEIYSDVGRGRHAIGGCGVASHSTRSSWGLSSYCSARILRGLILTDVLRGCDNGRRKARGVRKQFSACGVREFVSEVWGNTTTYDGHWRRRTTHEN
jgi:hypothetical protein